MQATLDNIDALESLPVKIEYVGEVPSPFGEINGSSMVDQWRVSLSSKAGYWSTNYYTGTGLRREVKGSRSAYVKTSKIVGNKWVTAEPVKPKVADVLYSLTNDADAADYNFHDWCDNFGYSNDSIKALNTYRECLEIGVALRKHLSPETLKKVRELLSDY